MPIAANGDTFSLMWRLRTTLFALVVGGCGDPNRYPWIDRWAVPDTGVTPRRDGGGPIPDGGFFELPTDAPTPVGTQSMLPAPTLIVRDPVPPPPISGGNVYATSDGATIVVADSDRDRVYLVDAATYTVRTNIELMPNDEPGRIAEDASGNVHVVLRRAGAVATIDPATGTILARRDVCGAPRGIAYDRFDSAIRIACLGGELVTIPDAGAPSTIRLPGDLRDIVVRERDIVVSTFRTAHVLFLDHRLQVISDRSLAVNPAFGTVNSIWRMVASGGDSVVLTAQASTINDVPGVNPVYTVADSPSCLGKINTMVIRLRTHDMPLELLHASRLLPLPVDVVDDGRDQWIVSAANRGERIRSRFDSFASVATVALDSCSPVRAPMIPAGHTFTGGAKVGAQMVFYSREPAGLFRTDGRQLFFAGARNVEHTGHRIFHGNFNARSGMACASCHPEAGDDGLVWNFATGPRRTPSLRGTVGGGAPYNWRGEFRLLSDLTENVFIGRMGGPTISADYSDHLQDFLDAVPSYRPTPSQSQEQTDAIARGETLFRSNVSNCVNCHGGPNFSNGRSTDIGTGGLFQVPSLRGIGFRAPYLHSGCATSLEMFLNDHACAGMGHGGFDLLPSQKTDLIAYLRSI